MSGIKDFSLESTVLFAKLLTFISFQIVEFVKKQSNILILLLFSNERFENIKYKNMKRLVFSILNLSFLLMSCQGQTHKEENEVAGSDLQITEAVKAEEVQVQTTTEGASIIKLNMYEYAKLVHDYKNNPNWKYNGKLPCVVDFYADWCRPCKMMDPIMEKLAKEYEGKVIFYKVNIDENKELATAYAINSIPFFLFCPMNGQAQSALGMMLEDDMRKAIESVLMQ